MLQRYVRVDLCTAQAGVAEQLLHGAQVGAAAQQMSGEGMAEGVRRALAMNAGAMQAAIQNPPHRAIGQARSQSV